MLADLTPRSHCFDKTSSWEANLNRRETRPEANHLIELPCGSNPTASQTLPRPGPAEAAPKQGPTFVFRELRRGARVGWTCPRDRVDLRGPWTPICFQLFVEVTRSVGGEGEDTEAESGLRQVYVYLAFLNCRV